MSLVPPRAAGAPTSTDDPSRPATPSAGTGQKRAIVPAIDGFRGLSGMLILLYHAFYFAGQPLMGEGVLRALLGAGYVGVDFFFVISGFVLFLPTALNAGEFGPVRPYFIRRVTRIVPPYYLFLLVVVLFHGWFTKVPTPLPFSSAKGALSGVLHLLFLQHNIGLFPFISGAGTMPEGFGVLSVVWTLNLEALFYLTLPLFASWFYRHPFLGLALALAVTLLWRLGATHVDTSLAWMGSGGWTPLETYAVQVILVTQIPNYVVDFAAGMMAAWLYAWLLPRWTPKASLRLALPVQLLSLGTLLALMHHEGNGALTHLTQYYIWTRATPIAFVFAVLVLSTILSVSWAQWPLSNPVSRWLGDVSYGVYLGHIVVIGFAVTTLGIAPSKGSTVMRQLLLVTIPATLVVAWLSLTFVEKPVRAWAKKRSRRSMDASAPAPL